MDWIGNFIWTSGSGRGEVRGSRKKFSGGEEGAERQMRFSRALGATKLGKIASGSATQSFWIRDKEMGSQVVGEDRSRLARKETIGKVAERR